MPDNIWAIDARSGRQIWRYTYPPNQGFHIGHRGAAVYKDTVFLTTPDAHLVALDAQRRQGEVGRRRSPTRRSGYWSTNAPLVIRNHVLVGVSGDFDNLPGILKSFDPETGKHAVDRSTARRRRHAGVDQRRRDRRADVDDRHLRSGSQSGLSSAPATRRRC